MNKIRMKKENKDTSLKIKKKICEALEGRKEKEEAIIGLFFGEGEMWKKGIKKHRKIYNSIYKKLKTMDIQKLDSITKEIGKSLFTRIK